MVSWWLRDRPASTELSQNDTKGSLLSKNSSKVAESGSPKTKGNHECSSQIVLMFPIFVMDYPEPWV